MTTTTTNTAPTGPPQSVQDMLSSMGLPDPRATTTSNTGTADSTADAASGTQKAETGTQANPSAAVTVDPLASSSAATAITAQTLAPEGGNSPEATNGQQTEAQSSGGMSSGAKIGIGVGVGVGVAVLIAVIALFFVMRKRRQNRYSSHPSAENMRGQPAMTSTEPALGAVSALGRSPSYRSNNRSSYHSLSPSGPPPMPHTATDPLPEPTKAGTIPAQPTIIPPSQQSLPHEPSEQVETPRGRRSMEAEVLASPATQSLATPAPPYEEAGPSPIDEPPSRPVSPVSPISPTGSRPHSLRRSFDN